MTDEKLYQLCKHYGAAARHWRQKFIGLLPEVNRRRLFERKGYQSIFEFASKLAGLSHDRVRQALNLEERFEDTPILKSMLVTGEVSINKLARVASIATPENEAILAEKVKLLPQKALETLVRDENSTGLRAQTLNFELQPELIEELNQLHAQGHDANSLLLKLLKQRKARIENEKEKLSAEVKTTDSRYIPVATRKLLREEFGQKCSIRTCAKPAEEIHHTQRFSLSHTHDPKYLAPLCQQHHQIAHFIDLKVQSRLKNARLPASSSTMARSSHT